MDSAPSDGSPTLTFEKGSCCLCGGEDGEVVVRSPGKTLGTTPQKYAFVRCPRCSVLFLNPRPTAESLPLLYRDDAYYSRDIQKLSNATSKSSPGLKQRLQARILHAYGVMNTSKVQFSRRSPTGYYGEGGSPKSKVEGYDSRGKSEVANTFRALFSAVGRGTVFPLLVRQSALLRTLVYNRWFLRFRRRPARILEVGFGNGLLLFALSHLDTELFGTEISQKACQAVSSSLGVETFCGQLWDAGYSDDQFDLVIFSHSLEHLSDPMRALHEARRTVAPDGGLIIGVPNPDCLSSKVFGQHWAGYDFPRHLFLFGRNALSRMADKAGFKLQRVRFPLQGCVHHLAQSINSRLGLRLIPDALTRTLLAQIPYLPFVAFRTGDVMTAYFRPQ